MDLVVAIPRGAIPMPELWNMGADDFGIRGDQLIVRVSAPMLDALIARDVPHELLCHDLNREYREFRRGTAATRAESFVDYHDLPGVQAAMRRIAEQFPDIVAIEEIGRSVENRPINALRISDNAPRIEPDEPAMIVMGCHHAREWISVEVPLYFADYLANNYRKNGAVTRLIRNSEIWIVPVVNPDGFAHSWVGFPDSFDHRWWRKNRRNNGDGTFGVDPNRNYLVGFGDDAGSSGLTFSEVYRGPAPFSEPETRAIRDLMTGVKFGRTFQSGVSYHNFSQLVMYPNGYSTAPVDNVREYQELAAEMTRLINGAHSDPRLDYIYGQGPELLYIASGTWEDWAHHTVGATAFIIELRPNGWPYFELPSDEIVPTCRENLPAFLYLAEQTMIPSIQPADPDDDGFIGDEDDCPNTPLRALVDDIGCADAEQDLDGDGIVNRLDSCRDTPAEQQVTSDGCRVPVVFALTVSSNIAGAEIQIVPRDIDNQQDGATSVTGAGAISRHYGEPTAVALTAPREVGGNQFSHWSLDGRPQPDGQPTIRFEDAVDAELRAVYRVPVYIDVIGPGRIPDRRDDGLGYVATYSVQIAFDDGVVALHEEPVQWTSTVAASGALTDQGDFLAYDVSAISGEVSTDLIAEINLGGRVLVSEPFSVRVFDAATRTPNCKEVFVVGPDKIESLSTTQFTARVLLEGESLAANRSAESYWLVTGVGEDAGSVAATARPGGIVEADWVPRDQEWMVKGIYLNDDGTACIAEKSIVVAAGDPADDPAGRESTSSNRACGAMGFIGLWGLAAGLWIIRWSSSASDPHGH